MTQRSLLILFLIGTLLASCAPSSPGTPTPDINTMVAANAQTMVAALFQTQTALAPSATNTALPTATALPTSTALTTLLSTPTTFIQQPVYIAATPTPTGTYYTATPLASSLAVGCNNLRLINSYTDPAGPFLPGQDFTQSWKVENNGTCDWMYVYSVVFASGDKLGEGSAVRLGNKIPPGKWTTLSVVLHAPNKSGTYKASWRLSDGAGTAFGAVLPVSITVNAPTKTPDANATAAAQQTAAAVLQQTIDAAVHQTQTAQASITPSPAP